MVPGNTQNTCNLLRRLIDLRHVGSSQLDVSHLAPAAYLLLAVKMQMRLGDGQHGIPIGFNGRFATGWKPDIAQYVQHDTAMACADGTQWLARKHPDLLFELAALADIHGDMATVMGAGCHLVDDKPTVLQYKKLHA